MAHTCTPITLNCSPQQTQHSHLPQNLLIVVFISISLCHRIPVSFTPQKPLFFPIRLLHSVLITEITPKGVKKPTHSTTTIKLKAYAEPEAATFPCSIPAYSPKSRFRLPSVAHEAGEGPPSRRTWSGCGAQKLPVVQIWRMKIRQGGRFGAAFSAYVEGLWWGWLLSQAVG